MSEPTYRESVVAEFVTRLQAITIANGFSADLGDSLYVGEVPDLGPDDPAAAVALTIGTDQILGVGEHVRIVLPLQISAVVRGEPNASVWMKVERILGDIKRAIEVETDPTRRLGGLLRERIERGNTQTLQREGGSTSSGAEIVYFVPMAEQWGHP